MPYTSSNPQPSGFSSSIAENTNMAASLLNIPLEILYMIIEDGGLSRSDIKCLRVVHRGLNALLSPQLFQRIGFSFTHEWNQALRMSRGGINPARKTRVQRLNSVKYLQESETTKIPETFYVTVTQKTGDMSRFVDCFDKLLDKMDQVFPSIKVVEVMICLSIVKVEDGRRLMQVLGKYTSEMRKKALRVNLTGITSFRLQTLAAVPAHVETLELSAGQITGQILTATTEFLSACTNLKDLSLQGFTSTRKARGCLFDQVPAEVLGGIRRISVLHPRYRGSHFPSPLDDGKRNLLNNGTVMKLSGLKYLHVDGVSAGLDKTGKTLWDDLSTTQIRLISLKPSIVDDSLIKYLSSAENASGLKEFMVKVDLRGLARLYSRTYEQTAQLWGNAFFNRILPKMQSTVQQLEFSLERFWLSDVSTEQSRSICTPLSFIDRGLEYNFPNLKYLSASVGWAQGRFDSFMKAIKRSPNLKLVQLSFVAKSAELDFWAEEGKKSHGYKNPIYSEIIAYDFQGTVWRPGLALYMQIMSDFAGGERWWHHPRDGAWYFPYKGRRFEQTGAQVQYSLSNMTPDELYAALSSRVSRD